MSWKDYFYFTKTERNGILVLVLLITLIAVYPFVHQRLFPQETYVYDDFSDRVKNYQELLAEYQNARRAFEEQNRIARTSHQERLALQLTPFRFDPNQLSQEEFTSLGLSERIARNIINYRNAGGSFRSKEDFARIWGIDEQVYNQLESYIDLPTRSELADRSSSGVTGSASGRAATERTSFNREPVRVNINTADTIEWLNVRGIGSVFSRRITSYRERLGGFHSIEQLREVFGMDSVRFDQISEFIYIDSIELQQININTADFVTLVRHPYLERNHVNSILQIRERHGEYQSVEDIRKSHLIDEELFRRIHPYLKVKDE